MRDGKFRARKVYSLVFAVEMDDVVVPVEYEWNSHKPTAHLQRQQAYEDKLTSRVQRSIKKALSMTLHSVILLCHKIMLI